MVEKYNIRTDLALEEKERFESDHVEVQGVILTEEYDEENEIRITTVRIETENGAKVMGKPVGSYITIEAPEMAVPDEGYHEEISQQLRKFIGELLPKRKMEKILVVGLGNRQVTPDALGPYVVDNLQITRHIIEEYGKYATGEDEVWSVSAIVPGVMGQTGMETVEVIRGGGGRDKTGYPSGDRCVGSEKFKKAEPDDPDCGYGNQSGIRGGKSPKCNHGKDSRDPGDCNRCADCSGCGNHCRRYDG